MAKMKTEKLMERVEQEIQKLIDWRVKILDEGRESLKRSLHQFRPPGRASDDEVNEIIANFDKFYSNSVYRKLKRFKTNLLNNKDFIACIEEAAESMPTSSPLQRCSPFLRQACLASNNRQSKLPEEAAELNREFEALLERTQQQQRQLSELRVAVKQKCIQNYLAEIKPSIDAIEAKLEDKLESRHRTLLRLFEKQEIEQQQKERTSCDASKKRPTINGTPLDLNKSKNEFASEEFEALIKPFDPYESIWEDEMQLYKNNGSDNYTDDENINSEENEVDLESTPRLVYASNSRTDCRQEDSANNNNLRNEEQQQQQQQQQENDDNKGDNKGRGSCIPVAQETYHSVKLQLKDGAGATRRPTVKLF